MSLDLTGIVNEQEFYTQHYLNAILEDDLKDVFSQWTQRERREEGYKTHHEIVRMAGDVSNESAAHAALMLYKAKALRAQGLHTAARDTLTAALRRTRDRSRDLLLALRYERALVYAELNQHMRSRTELEKVYSQDVEYEDVGALLGISS
ncbi:hypothetical protein [Desulfonatronum thioautotrophicum]|uniref:hypothetical protein n=1 Tax=Desulfonatronum thioautotrophicum TaxID=617001 RepID=UPI0005EBACDA|nr:hypothetical protein [Desulfonatronum thioautotrophicum]